MGHQVVCIAYLNLNQKNPAFQGVWLTYLMQPLLIHVKKQQHSAREKCFQMKDDQVFQSQLTFWKLAEVLSLVHAKMVEDQKNYEQPEQLQPWPYFCIDL